MRLATRSQITQTSLLTSSSEWTTSPSQFCHFKKAHIYYQTFRFHTPAAKPHPWPNNKHRHRTHIYCQTFTFHTPAAKPHPNNTKHRHRTHHLLPNFQIPHPSCDTPSKQHYTHVYHQIFRFHTFRDWAALDRNWGVTFLTSLPCDWHVMENPSCETPTPQNFQTLESVQFLDLDTFSMSLSREESWSRQGKAF